MNELPTHVTHAQMKAVCDILGLPGELVRTLTLDAAEGLTFTAYVKDGKEFVAGPNGEAVTATARVPVDDDEPAPGGLAVIGEDVPGCYLPRRERPSIGINVEFDSSPGAAKRLSDALRFWTTGRP